MLTTKPFSIETVSASYSIHTVFLVPSNISFSLTVFLLEPLNQTGVVADYNLHMIGVDKMDQIASYYSFTHKTVKWWRKVFFWLLQVAVVNTYIIHKKLQLSVEMPAKSHTMLHCEVLMELCRPLMQLQKPPTRVYSDHSLERLQKVQCFSTKRIKRKDCCVCNSRDERTE